MIRVVDVNGTGADVSIEGGSITFADALNGKGNATNFPNALTADLILTSTGDIAFQAGRRGRRATGRRDYRQRRRRHTLRWLHVQP